MNIGEISLQNGRLMGRIATRTIDLPRIGLRPVESQNPRAPRYEVVALNVARRWVQIGALWEAETKKTGEVFLAGNIDDPSLPEPLPVALFRNEGGGYAIAWRRDTLRSEAVGPGFGASNFDMQGGDADGRYEGGAERGFGGSTAGPDGTVMRQMALAGADEDDDIAF
ncbi:DUF736 domain-containing protein [Novosphingobium sediminicola]|uniref:Uncharacterized protein (DUF736 family) n=1 Tax=Novosphingobium sediminicola TaxID=563162 RepID=A0A7W6CJJ2_9SPHN|nr:DUF736 domain-containing protein [Novosphingobium sediminicola]MBB3957706.1 uncharacterized protein (DUF736 family) [Novosphingobium sediminicola]